MEKEYSNTKPKKLTYIKLSNGKAEVWLRKNITKETETHEDGTEQSIYTSDTVMFNTDLSESYISRHFDELFDNPPEEFTIETAEPILPTLEDRIHELEERVQINEDAVVELAEMIGG